MKAKISVSKRVEVQQEPPPQQKPLGKDKVIELLEQAYEENVNLALNLIDDLLPVLLFLDDVIVQAAFSDSLDVAVEGRKIPYCSATDAIGNILGMFPGRLYNARNRVDEASTEIARMMRDYKKSEPMVGVS